VRRVQIPPCPAALDPSGSAGADERARAIAHFEATEAEPATAFNFVAYRDKTVKDALDAAFGGVCAYCETPTAAHPVEVEHYRPKGAVRTENGARPHGYYWLAATWENLLPSCIRCNRAEGYDYEDGTRRTSGKGAWFPLADEGARARAPGDEAGESPLLLHPYYDDPTEHLEFVGDGLVAARLDENNQPSVRGEWTIRVLGLNRPALVDARRAHLKSVEAHETKLRLAERLVANHPDSADARALLEQERLEHEKFVRLGAPYSALAAQLLELDRPAGG
jgi:uncharacterized protein (TIGR02646 family)